MSGCGRGSTPGWCRQGSSTSAGADDIRVGIDLVRDVAMRAEGEGRRRVDRKDVMAAASVPGSSAFAVRVAALSAGERVLLYRIAERSLSGDTMMAGAIFEEAQDYLATGRRENIDHPRVEVIEGRTTDLPPRRGRHLAGEGPPRLKRDRHRQGASRREGLRGAGFPRTVQHSSFHPKRGIPANLSVSPAISPPLPLHFGGRK